MPLSSGTVAGQYALEDPGAQVPGKLPGGKAKDIRGFPGQPEPEVHRKCRPAGHDRKQVVNEGFRPHAKHDRGIPAPFGG